MTEDRGILIKNIYYMLSYAFRILKEENYDEVETEEFENIQDLFAAILGRGIARQIKHGLYREYIVLEENRKALRGKLLLQGTIQNKMQKKVLLDCEFDELSVDNIYNQILKTTMHYLVRHANVKTEHKEQLKKNLLYFDEVHLLQIAEIRWDALRFTKNNQEYRMLINVCNLVLDGLLISTEKGTYKMANFLDEQKLHRLYEKFILEYYRYHYPHLHANPDQIEWNTDDGIIAYLPAMQTDITLKAGGKTLIIDAKYYSQTMQTQYNVSSLHSANLYQIFTYVKNLDANNTGNVAGMLLYAKTQEEITPNFHYQMTGNHIFVRTLDLNRPFIYISEQLNSIADSYFFTEQQKESV